MGRRKKKKQHHDKSQQKQPICPKEKKSNHNKEEGEARGTKLQRWVETDRGGKTGWDGADKTQMPGRGAPWGPACHRPRRALLCIWTANPQGTSDAIPRHVSSTVGLWGISPTEPRGGPSSPGFLPQRCPMPALPRQGCFWAPKRRPHPMP